MLTQARLKELLEYDPETGIFRWLRGSFASRKAGGPGNEGYWRIWVDGQFYNASRLAWFYVTGAWPPHQIDHINRVPDDNRWINLRAATQSQNKANSGCYRNNQLGIKGVRLHRNGQYEARLRVNGELVYLGCYRTIDEAKAVYDAAALDAFGDFARSV